MRRGSTSSTTASASNTSWRAASSRPSSAWFGTTLSSECSSTVAPRLVLHDSVSPEEPASPPQDGHPRPQKPRTSGAGGLSYRPRSPRLRRLLAHRDRERRRQRRHRRRRQRPPRHHRRYRGERSGALPPKDGAGHW